jgi:hypothetical protein
MINDGAAKACSGLILTLVLRLRELEIEILSNFHHHGEESVWSDQRYENAPIDKLFGAPAETNRKSSLL